VTRLKDFREMGIVPAALLNYLGTIGRNVKKEIMDMSELAGTFSLTSLSRTDSFFDMEKLYWFNKEYMKHVPLDTLLMYLDLPGQYNDKITVLRENTATLNEMKDYLDIFDKTDISAEGMAYLSQLALSDDFVAKIADFFTANTSPSVESIVNTLMMEGPGLKKRDIYMILRIFFTGRKSGPPLKEILQLIPNDIIIKRISRYLEATRQS
jgi:glutamyl/glutaminyl-tRNA synthetase